MVVCNNHYRLLIFLIFLFNMGVVILILKHNNGLCYDDNRNAGIYPSNFDFRYTAQKTQSFNWVFKFNLRKILLKHLDIALGFQINLLTRFLLFWAIYLFSRCKKANMGFTPWIATKAPPWTLCGDYRTLRPPPAFYNIQKLNLCSKTDISKTAWIYLQWVVDFIDLPSKFGDSSSHTKWESKTESHTASKS